MRTYAIIASLMLSTGAGAQDAGFEQFLFPPDLVMRFQSEIELQPEQREVITTAIGELQAKVTELQWDMQLEHHELSALLQSDVVDQGAAVARLERILAIENEIKKSHITMLVIIKNTLTPDQQARLRELRPAASNEPPVRRPDQPHR